MENQGVVGIMRVFVKKDNIFLLSSTVVEKDLNFTRMLAKAF